MDILRWLVVICIVIFSIYNIRKVWGVPDRKKVIIIVAAIIILLVVMSCFTMLVLTEPNG